MQHPAARCRASSCPVCSQGANAPLLAVVLPRTSDSIAPALASNEVGDAVAHFIADLAHASERLALGVFERPVLSACAGHDRARLAASHRDKHGHARRDVVLQLPYRTGQLAGTFALRSPLRPNPIASAIVDLVAIEQGVLLVRGLDCLDGTPLIDLKPDRLG